MSLILFIANDFICGFPGKLENNSGYPGTALFEIKIKLISCVTYKDALPDSNSNELVESTLFLLSYIPSTLIRHENGTFRKRSSN